MRRIVRLVLLLCVAASQTAGAWCPMPDGDAGAGTHAHAAAPHGAPAHATHLVPDPLAVAHAAHDPAAAAPSSSHAPPAVAAPAPADDDAPAPRPSAVCGAVMACGSMLPPAPAGGFAPRAAGAGTPEWPADALRSRPPTADPPPPRFDVPRSR